MIFPLNRYQGTCGTLLRTVRVAAAQVAKKGAVLFRVELDHTRDARFDTQAAAYAFVRIHPHDFRPGVLEDRLFRANGSTRGFGAPQADDRLVDPQLFQDRKSVV